MRILLVEDDAPLRDALRASLAAEGWVVDACADGEEALWLGNEDAFDAVVLATAGTTSSRASVPGPTITSPNPSRSTKWCCASRP